MNADATFYATGVVLTLWGLLEIPYGALNVTVGVFGESEIGARRHAESFWSTVGQLR